MAVSNVRQFDKKCMSAHEYASRVVQELLRSDYVVVNVENLSVFKSVCSVLGRVAQWTDVRVLEDGIQYPNIPDAIPFHTDNPKMAIVGWFCVCQDSSGGENWLMPAKEIVEQLSADDRERLVRILLRTPSKNELYPLLREQPEFQVFYVPRIWLEAVDSLLPQDAGAIRRFHDAVLANRDARNYIAVRLAPGEALFINNRTLIHGRGALPKASQRHLVRAYIDTAD